MVNGAHIFRASRLKQHSFNSTIGTLTYTTFNLLSLEANQIFIRKSVLFKFITNLHNLMLTIDLNEKANISPGNSLFFGII